MVFHSYMKIFICMSDGEFREVRKDIYPPGGGEALKCSVPKRHGILCQRRLAIIASPGAAEVLPREKCLNLALCETYDCMTRLKFLTLKCTV